MTVRSIIAHVFVLALSMMLFACNADELQLADGDFRLPGDNEFSLDGDSSTDGDTDNDTDYEFDIIDKPDGDLDEDLENTEAESDTELESEVESESETELDGEAEAEQEPSDDNVVVDLDFSNNDPSGWLEAITNNWAADSIGWEITGGSLALFGGELGNGGGGLALYRDAPLANLAFSADLQMIEGPYSTFGQTEGTAQDCLNSVGLTTSMGVYGLLARFDPMMRTGYSLQCSTLTNGTCLAISRLEGYEPGYGYDIKTVHTVLAALPLIDTGFREPHRFQLVANGSTLSAYVDGVAKLEVQDSTHSDGYWALHNVNGKTLFDNIRIRDCNMGWCPDDAPDGDEIPVDGDADGDQEPNELISYDLDEGKPSYWIETILNDYAEESIEWSLHDGFLEMRGGLDQDGGGGLALTRDYRIADAGVNADVAFVEGPFSTSGAANVSEADCLASIGNSYSTGPFGIAARFEPESRTGYAMIGNPLQDGGLCLQLVRLDGFEPGGTPGYDVNTTHTVLDAVALGELDARASHTFSLSARGSALAGAIDGVAHVAAIDESYTTGYYALINANGASRFDNILVLNCATGFCLGLD